MKIRFIYYEIFSGSSYEANLKPDQVNSLASLTQARSQNVTTKDVSTIHNLLYVKYFHFIFKNINI